MNCHILITTLATGLGLYAVSCGKSPETEVPVEVILNVAGDDGFSVETKTESVNAVPSFLYWCATTGISGTDESAQFEPTGSAVSNGKISTGKYATTAISYNWYVADVGMEITSSGPTISVDNTIDHVAGAVRASASTSPSVTLKHIFARTGALSATTDASGCSISSATYTIKGAGGINGTAGVYNIATESWTATTAPLSHEVEMSEFGILPGESLFLIPGKYIITATYSYKDVNEVLHSGRTATAEVDLTGGYINTFICVLPAEEILAQDIRISVLLYDWTEEEVNPKFKS